MLSNNGLCLALYPDPAQLSVTCSTEKWERAWYLFSCEWCQDRKDGRKGFNCAWADWAQNSEKSQVPGNLLHLSS